MALHISPPGCWGGLEGGTTAAVRGHGSPPRTLLFSIQGTRSSKRASGAARGVTLCPPQGKPANVANAHQLASLN